MNFGDIVSHIPPEPFYSHPDARVILKEEVKEHSDESWFSQRIEAFKVFIANVTESLNVADNYRFSADNESYKLRLIKYLERAERK